MTRRLPLLAAGLALGGLVAAALVLPRHTAAPPAPAAHRDLSAVTTISRATTPPIRLTSAPAALQLWMESIAGNDGSRACSTMTEAARQHLAEELAQSDCVTAITQLARQIDNPRTYLTYGYSPSTYRYPSRQHDPIVIDGCTVTWNDLVDGPRPAPGPRPGRLELTHDPERGLVVTGWNQC